MNDMKFPRKVDSEIRVKLFEKWEEVDISGGEFQYSIWGLGRNGTVFGVWGGNGTSR